MKGAINLAYDILEMRNRIGDLESEVTRLMWYEKAYNELSTSSLQHSEKMMGNMLEVLMTPGVTEAFCKAKEKS